MKGIHIAHMMNHILLQLVMMEKQWNSYSILWNYLHFQNHSFSVNKLGIKFSYVNGVFMRGQGLLKLHVHYLLENTCQIYTKRSIKYILGWREFKFVYGLTLFKGKNSKKHHKHLQIFSRTTGQFQPYLS